MLLPAARSTSLDEVRRELIACRESGGSLPWTLAFLEHADRQFAGRWSQIEITGLDALDIVLPPHSGEPCKGDRMELVPPGGATVRDAAERLRRSQTEYADTNPECWRRILTGSAEPLTSVIVAAAPLSIEQYRDIPTESGRLYHVDGFHRLVGWAWAGRVNPQTRVRAFLAGTTRF